MPGRGVSPHIPPFLEGRLKQLREGDLSSYICCKLTFIMQDSEEKGHNNNIARTIQLLNNFSLLEATT